MYSISYCYVLAVLLAISTFLLIRFSENSLNYPYLLAEREYWYWDLLFLNVFTPIHVEQPSRCVWPMERSTNRGNDRWGQIRTEFSSKTRLISWLQQSSSPPIHHNTHLSSSSPHSRYHQVHHALGIVTVTVSHDKNNKVNIIETMLINPIKQSM